MNLLDWKCFCTFHSKWFRYFHCFFCSFSGNVSFEFKFKSSISPYLFSYFINSQFTFMFCMILQFRIFVLLSNFGVCIGINSESVYSVSYISVQISRIIAFINIIIDIISLISIRYIFKFFVSFYANIWNLFWGIYASKFSSVSTAISYSECLVVGRSIRLLPLNASLINS